MNNQPQKQFYTEVADKLNEYVRFAVRDKIIELQEQLKIAEGEGSSDSVHTCLASISVLQKEKHADKYTVELFV
jgi:hypothetical protein